jgi:Mn-dependent DtxR family transcriptional regulator
VGVEVDRRDTTRRAEVVRTVLEEIVHTSVPFITIETITKSLHVSTEAATRIIERLVSAGLLVETREGIWIRVSP